MNRTNERIQFENPPLTNAKLLIVDGLRLSQEETEVKLNDLSVTGLRFSTDLNFSIGQHLVIEVSLFTPTNHLFGEVVWKEASHHEYTYGIKIISADLSYYQYMQSYETYLENRKSELLVGGRQ